MKTKTTDAFVRQILEQWHSKETMKKADIRQVTVETNYQTLRNDIDSSKFGNYATTDVTGTPSQLSLPKELLYKDVADVATYLEDTNTAGFETMEEWVNSPETAPQWAKDGNYHFFFGSVFRGSRGGWRVPCVRWGGSSFEAGGSWLGHWWDSVCRVVVLETDRGPLASASALHSDPLAPLAPELEKAIEVCKAAGMTVTKTY